MLKKVFEHYNLAKNGLNVLSPRKKRNDRKKRKVAGPGLRAVLNEAGSVRFGPLF